MAYDQDLALRVRKVFENSSEVCEKKMFGGICFLANGNMACGVLDDLLIVRVGQGDYEQALEHPHVREFDITGRAMRGWVMVAPEGWELEAQLEGWVRRGLRFARSLPPR